MGSTVGLKNLGNTCYLNSLLQALASCDAFARQLGEALNGAGDAAAASDDASPLSAALLACLTALQPAEGDTAPATGKSVSPFAVWRGLQAWAGEEALPAGREHDVGEALAATAAAVAADLAVTYSRRCAGAAQPAASLAALLQPSDNGLLRPDAALAAWAGRRLRCEGSAAHEMRCLHCGHRSGLEVAPFVCLPLALPAAPGFDLVGNVPVAPGASLLGILRAHFGYETITGVRCTRCSLRASLDAAPRPLPAPLEPLAEALAEGHPLLESEAYEPLLGSCGVGWLHATAVVARRCVLARRPAVLCLQLRRGFWAPHGRVKAIGHVAFPLHLDLAQLPSLGEEGSPVGTPPACTPCTYSLRAVVVHSGMAEGGGHYATLRALPRSGEGEIPWVWASDQDVRPVSEAEVLAAEAALLFYQSDGCPLGS